MLVDRSVCVVCVRVFRRNPLARTAERALRDLDRERVDMVAKAPETLATSGLKQGRHVLMTAQDISIMVQTFEFEKVSFRRQVSANLKSPSLGFEFELEQVLHVISAFETARIVLMRYILAIETL